MHRDVAPTNVHTLEPLVRTSGELLATSVTRYTVNLLQGSSQFNLRHFGESYAPGRPRITNVDCI